ncbi:MAG TPA: hypothetical protein V6D17_03445 [Candidatus Obscuribacterales bacterium]
MGFWTIILLCALLAGSFGWVMIPMTHCYLWFLNWCDEEDVNWGYNAGLALAVPCAWIYSILVIIIMFTWRAAPHH